jgi:tight adherence protein C
MRTAVALVVALGIFLAASDRRTRPLTERLDVYLRPAGRRAAGPATGHRRIRMIPGPAAAGRLGAAAGGAAAGALLAGGDLFATAAPGSSPALTAAGAATGLLALRMSHKRRAAARSDRLRQELPTVADTLSLRVLAGASVSAAIEQFTLASRGVAAEELGSAIEAHRGGIGLAEALSAAAASTAHPEAGRLYGLLGHAHRTGGRLADALGDLALDYRAAIARDLTAEGGRRAMAAYGPILALMVPVSLLFLMYPTLTGLNALSQSP